MKKWIGVGLFASLAVALASSAAAQKHLDVPVGRTGYSCSWLAGGGLKLSGLSGRAADIRLIVDFDDTIYFNGKVIDFDALKPLLAGAADAKHGMLAVQLEPHPMAKRQYVTRVVAAANDAGVSPACLAAS